MLKLGIIGLVITLRRAQCQWDVNLQKRTRPNVENHNENDNLNYVGLIMGLIMGLRLHTFALTHICPFLTLRYSFVNFHRFHPPGYTIISH